MRTSKRGVYVDFRVILMRCCGLRLAWLRLVSQGLPKYCPSCGREQTSEAMQFTQHDPQAELMFESLQEEDVD